MKLPKTLIALLVAAGTAGCASPDRETEDGVLRGELRIYRVSYDDGRVEREFFLAPDARSSDVTKLIFPADPELAPWTRLKIWGELEGEQLRVARHEIDVEAQAEEETKTQAESLIGAPQRTRTVGFVLADVGGGVNISNADAQTAIFGTRNGDPGLWEYYLDASYGTLRFTGEVLGPTPVTDLGSCDTASVVRIENRWASTFGKTFNHWMTYIGSRYSNCGWGGIGGEGTAARPAYGSWYNASTGCVVLAQEIGHNLGLNHAGTMDCGTSTIMPDDPRNGCTGAEYGNRYTPMGGGCLHMNAYEKWYEGFMGGCNGVKVRSSGTFTLLPIATACNGVQALQIPMAKQRAFRNGTARDVTLNYYYLELRTRQGMDDRGTGGPVTQPTVLVHVVGDVPQPSIVSTFTWVLDMVPSTNPFDGMSAGQTFTDPAGGVSFQVQALSAERATINVTLQNGSGSNTCIDGSAFTAPGPDSCGTGGTGGTGGTSGTGGTGGTNGTGGTSGSGGTAGTAGTAGTSGSSGTGGGSGTGGNAGAAGAATGGTSGSNGSGGASGSGAGGTNGSASGGTGSGAGGSEASGGNAGAGGDGGALGTAGTGAAASGGSNGAGASGAAGAGAAPAKPTNPVALDESDGSCSCRTAAPRTNAWALLLLPLAGAIRLRRRKRG